MLLITDVTPQMQAAFERIQKPALVALLLDEEKGLLYIGTKQHGRKTVISKFQKKDLSQVCVYNPDGTFSTIAILCPLSIFEAEKEEIMN